ncbi:MAG: FG-GAP repeat domain-containing protein [Nodosilinea sp.]
MTSTVIYDPGINPDPLATGFLTYGQLPTFPIYVRNFPPSSITDIIDVFEVEPLARTTGSNGVTLNTNGTFLQSSPGYEPFPYYLSGGSTKDPTGRNLSLTAKEGYAGFTNYTINLDLANINPFNFNLDSAALVPVGNSFPTLDPVDGFTLEFDLAITQEQSNVNRAGFSFTLISSNLTKGAEFGFKEQGSNTDYIFIQNANLNAATEGEKSTAALEISNTNRFRITVDGGNYTLSANGSTVLTGQLRDYSFSPQNSSPPFPNSINPYETSNFIFFGDNTDQGFAEFTLGEIVINTLDTEAPTEGPDFNSDGQTDVVWRNANGQSVIWFLDGPVPVSVVPLLSPVPPGWELNALGDFDQNGTHDLVWRNQVSGQTTIWLMAETAPLTAVVLPDVPTGWQVGTTVDFDNDGEIDLLWRNNTTGENVVWLMDGTTPQGSTPLIPVPVGWEIGGAADFNGDGQQDIVWRNNASGTNLVWFMAGTTPTSSAEILSVPTGWDIAGVTDFNQNGAADILWRNRASGETLIWLMNGFTPDSAVNLPTVPTDWTAVV